MIILDASHSPRRRRERKIARGKREARHPWDASGASILRTGGAREFVAPFQDAKHSRELDPGAAQPAVACTWLPSARAAGADSVKSHGAIQLIEEIATEPFGLLFVPDNGIINFALG